MTASTHQWKYRMTDHEVIVPPTMQPIFERAGYAPAVT